jgi:hypothetical protein
MRKRDLIRIIESALVFKMYDDNAVPGVIDCLLEDVCQTLKYDLRLSRLSCQEFDALLTAFAGGARRLLGEYARIEWEYAAQHIDWEYVARNVTDAVIDEKSKEFDFNDGGVL